MSKQNAKYNSPIVVTCEYNKKYTSGNKSKL